VHLRRLALEHFRNYARLDLELDAGRTLILGENAQGKTNLLEAIAVFATGRSERVEGDADFIGWEVREDPQPYARVTADVARAGGDVGLDLTVVGRRGVHGNLTASKRFKVNGVPRRASDAVGTLTAVLFTTDDMDLVKGAPSGRRRFLDVMLGQVDRDYRRSLQRYGKLLTQRNALLKRVQAGQARPDELPYWDGELAGDGAVLVAGRSRALAELAPEAEAAHARLSGGREALAVTYEPRFAEGLGPARLAKAEAADIATALLDRLQATHARDVAAGVTLVGPHRDDFGMTLGGEPAAAFASRGQQRSAALALRLAEARLIVSRTGEQPVLLLDDVLSELDEGRRASVLASVEADQLFITSPDPDRFSAGFTAEARVLRVAGGGISEG
jgi:DNA replication and repair protein RecF